MSSSFTAPRPLFVLLLCLGILLGLPGLVTGREAPPPKAEATPMVGTPPVAGDPSVSGELFETLAALDQQVFEASFVTCDLERVLSFFTEDAEFYHDQTGFETGESLRATFERLTTSCPGRQGVRRVRLDETLRVYPMADYGAVQMGLHRFLEEGRPGTTARFVHLWKETEDGWKLSRVLSFDHRPEEP